MKDLNITDLQGINGGGPIADLVEAVLCSMNDFWDGYNPNAGWPFHG